MQSTNQQKTKKNYTNLQINQNLQGTIGIIIIKNYYPFRLTLVHKIDANRL